MHGGFFLPFKPMLSKEIYDLLEKWGDEEVDDDVLCIVCEVKDYYGRWDRSLWRFLEEVKP